MKRLSEWVRWKHELNFMVNQLKKYGDKEGIDFEYQERGKKVALFVKETMHLSVKPCSLL